jgi:hypothetical protein
MLQVFQMDAAKVDCDVAYVLHICCNDYTRMLQASVSNVSSVFRRMLQVFYLDVAYCNDFQVFLGVLQVFQMCVASVSDVCCKCFIWMLQK